jgi:hypothetical protein
MDLKIEPVTASSWPLYKIALRALKLPVPRVRPKLGLLLTRKVNESRVEAVSGGCIFLAGDLALLLHAFGREWQKDETRALVAPWLERLGQSLADLAYMHGTVVLAVPWNDNSHVTLQAMGYRMPITGLGR